jgi:hypothetical protein
MRNLINMVKSLSGLAFWLLVMAMSLLALLLILSAFSVIKLPFWRLR